MLQAIGPLNRPESGGAIQSIFWVIVVLVIIVAVWKVSCWVKGSANGKETTSSPIQKATEFFSGPTDNIDAEVERIMSESSNNKLSPGGGAPSQTSTYEDALFDSLYPDPKAGE